MGRVLLGPCSDGSSTVLEGETQGCHAGRRGDRSLWKFSYYFCFLNEIGSKVISREWEEEKVGGEGET